MKLEDVLILHKGGRDGVGLQSLNFLLLVSHFGTSQLAVLIVRSPLS